MVLLVAAAGVGIVRGQGNTITVDGVEWQYAKIPWTNTCRIQIPESNRSSISGSVTIPKEVGSPSLTVVEIAENAFKSCSNLTEIIIQNPVQTIGEFAFFGCSQLKEMSIPNSVTTIKHSAFSNCSGLKEFKVGEGNADYCAVDSVLFTKGMGTLVRCPEKKNGAYEIPGSVTEIGWGAFDGCDGLTAVTIPGSVQTIGKRAFSGCMRLKEVNIPEGVTTIEEYTFQTCIALKKVVIPSSVKTIGGDAFFGCSGLTGVKISEGVETIGHGAFISCKGLTEVKIPNGVKRIGDRAFDDCKGLNAVYWFVTETESCKVAKDAFKGIGSSATLYVRKGKKTEIAGESWCNGKFTNVVECYLVTFDAQGGTPTPDVQMVEEGKTATAPTAAPTRDGYTFVEWQRNNAKYDFINTKVTEDITLVAVWKEVAKYTVTFDAKGGTPAPGAQKVVKDGTATAPTAPTKDGYTFVEWQLDGAKYDFSAKVTKDITLVAVWKKKEESTPSTPKDPKDPKTAVESVQLAGVRVVRNPVGEALELEGMERAARVEVYSVVGARVHAEALRGEPRVVIDARGWARGVYVVRVEASDGERTLRVVK